MNQVLVSIDEAGLGDCFQYRMIASAIRKAHPRHEVVLAIKAAYHGSVSDHPDILHLADIRKVEPADYDYHYDLAPVMSWACGRGRSVPQYWAASMGIRVRDWDMQFHITDEERNYARNIIGDKPTVALCPTASTFTRTLNPKTRQGVAEAILERGWQVVLLHKEILPDLPSEVLQLEGMGMRELISLHDAVDCCVTVDTVHSHITGGMGKPSLHLYHLQCGHVYTQFYRNCHILQPHPPGERDQVPNMDFFTVENIMAAFDRINHA